MNKKKKKDPKSGARTPVVPFNTGSRVMRDRRARRPKDKRNLLREFWEVED